MNFSLYKTFRKRSDISSQCYLYAHLHTFAFYIHSHLPLRPGSEPLQEALISLASFHYRVLSSIISRMT